MKKRFYKLVSAAIIAVASAFVLTGSYIFINKPKMPKELRHERN